MKNQTVRNTAILILVFAALAVYFFTSEDYLGGGAATSTPGAPGAYPEMYRFASNQAVELNISAGVTQTVMRREDDTKPWMIVEPVSDEANSTTVNTSIEQMSNYRAVRVMTDTQTVQDLAGFGLAPAHFTVTVKLKDGTTQSLVVGDKTPEMVNRYTQKPGDPGVYVVSQSLPDGFEAMLNTPPIKPTPMPTLEPIAPITDTVILTGSAPVTGAAPAIGTPQPLTATLPVTQGDTVTASAPVTGGAPVAAPAVVSDVGPITSTLSLTNAGAVTP